MDKSIFLLFLSVILLTGFIGIVQAVGTSPAIDPSIVLYYKFNNQSAYGENNTRVYDFSGNGNNGTVIGGAVWNSTGGYLGDGSLRFNGSSPTILQIKNQLVVNTSCMWISADYSPNGQVVLGNGTRYFGIRGSHYYSMYNSPTWISSINWALPNYWDYVCISYNGTGYDFYYNGVFSKFMLGGILNNVQNISTAIGNNNFTGSLDDLIIWNRSLSANEIYINYQSYLTKKHINFQGYSFDFNPNTIELNYLYPITKISSASGRAMVLRNDGVIYVYDIVKSKVVKSIDGGLNWNIVSPQINTGGSRMMFVDSNSNVFLDGKTDGFLWVSIGNDTNWTRTDLNSSCGVDGSIWSMTEDTKNNMLYAGQYSGGAQTENCSFVYNSSNGLNWSVSFNGTQFGIKDARHIHSVYFDSVNNYTYASLGDLAGRSGLIMRNFTTDWTVILNNTLLLSNYWKGNINFIPIVSTSNYRFYGSDALCGEIIRTADDITYDLVYSSMSNSENNGSINCGYLWTASKDNFGNIYFGFSNSRSNRNPRIIMTPDEGNSFYTIYNEGISEINFGIFKITNFDSLGNAYFTDGTSISKFQSANFNSLQSLLFKNIGNYTSNVEYSGFTSALLTNGTSLCNGSSSNLALNSGQVNITLLPSGSCYVLDSFNLTEGVSREFSPLAIVSKTSFLSQDKDTLTYTLNNSISTLNNTNFIANTKCLSSGDTVTFTSHSGILMNPSYVCLSDNLVKFTLNNWEKSSASNTLLITYNKQPQGGGGGLGGDPLANTGITNLSAYLCEKTYQKTLSEIPNIQELIKFEKGYDESFTLLESYIKNWQQVCSDELKKTLEPKYVCEKIYYYMLGKSSYNSNDIINLREKITNVKLSLDLVSYYVKNYKELCYQTGYSDELAELKDEKVYPILLRNVTCELSTNNEFFDWTFPPKFLKFKVQVGINDCMNLDTLKWIFSYELIEGKYYFRGIRFYIPFSLLFIYLLYRFVREGGILRKWLKK